MAYPIIMHINYFEQGQTIDYTMRCAKLLGYENILVYDSYGVENGFASKLGSVLMKAGYKGNFIAKAIGNDFVSHMSIKEQKSLYGLNPEEMLEFIKATY